METANKTSTVVSCLQVFRLSFRRQFFTRQTIVIVLLLGLAMLITFLGTWRETLNTPAELASKILSPLYMGFLLPIICLGYASAAISGERSEQTLVYLLTTNIPRPLVYLSK